MSPHRVLIVDDHDGARMTIAALLEEEGFEVTEAVGVADAATQIDASTGLDIALLDLNLGDGSGTDLIPVLRARYPQVRVVVLSGSEADPSKSEGVDAWVAKGGDFDGFLSSIQDLVSRGE